MNHWKRPAAVLCMAALLLGGCRRVSEEQLAYRESGIAFLEQGDYAGALDQFEKALADSGRVADFETDVLKYRAEAEYRLEDYEAAAHTYDLLSQLDTERPEYDYYWAMCLARSGDPESAEEKLAKGRALEASKKPQNAGKTKGRPDGGETAGNAAAQDAPGERAAQDAAGNAAGERTAQDATGERAAQNAPGESGNAADGARQMYAPGYVDAMTAAADAWLAKQNTEKADAIYSQLMADDLADTRLYNRMAKACMEQQDYEKALDYVEQGLALEDGLAGRDLKFNQAVCYEYLGDFQGALELFQDYVAEFGSDEAAEHEIAFLVTR